VSGRLRALTLAGALLGVVAAGAASAPIYVSGQLKPLSCVTDDAAVQGSGCTGAPGLRDAAYLSVSPDGRSVYVAGRQSETVTALVRNRLTGALTKLAGASGCASRSVTPGCGVAPLARPSVSTVSPDGRFLYVVSENNDQVVVFKRNQKTGGITLASCVGATQRDPSCAAIPALETPIGLTVSPDGRQLYVAAWAEDALVILNRDAATGALTFAACWSGYGPRHPASGCGQLNGSDGMSWVTVSPDGRNVYAAARDDNAIHAFARDPATGAVAWLGCVGGLASGIGKPAACGPARGLDYPQLVTVSPDGANVYATSADSHAIVIFSRNPATGAITQLAEADGCIVDIADGKEDCQRSLGLSLPLGLALDPTGTTAYIGAFGYGSVAMYRRDPATGLLSRVSPCFAQSDPDCTVRKPMDRAGYTVVTPDGRDVLVNAPGAGAVQVFARMASPAVPRIAGKKLLVRTGRATLQLSCPKDDTIGCFGELRLRALGASGRPVGKGVRLPFDLGPGKKTKLRPRLDAASRKALRATDHDVVLVELTCLEPGGDRNVVPRWMTVR
jgi:6-phosphogluconolactonase (cycloisomerase 2 family)